MIAEKRHQKIVDALRIEVSRDAYLIIKNHGEPDDYPNEPIQVNIYGYMDTDDGSEETWVVSASAYLFDRKLCWEEADDFSEDTANIAEVICDGNGEIKTRYSNGWGSTACFMDRIFVPEELRECGIASILQKNLKEVIQRVVPDLCGIYAYAAPWELKDDHDAFQKRQKELIRFYKKFGFKQIKGTPVIWMPVDEPS